MYYRNSVLFLENEMVREIPCDKKVYISSDFKVGTKEKNIGDLTCYNENNIAILNIGQKKIELKPYEKYVYNDKENLSIIYFINDRKKVSIKGNSFITIGDSKDSSIYLKNIKKLNLRLEKGKLYRFTEYEIYVNGKLAKENPIVLSEDDLILIDKVKITYHNNVLYVEGDSRSYETSLHTMDLEQIKFEGFPEYKRSPRIIKDCPTETVNFKNPPSKVEKKKGQLVRFIAPPLVMLIITIAISLISPRGIYIIMSIAGMGMSAVFSATSYISDKKEDKRKNKLRKEVYNKYLLNLRKKLDNLRRRQMESLKYHNPTLKQIDKMTEFYSSRIYERTYTDEDFLSISIGNADIEPSYKMKFSNESIQLEKDELLEQANEVYNEFSMVKDMPIAIDLKKAHFGLVGEKKYIHEQLNIIFAQLTLFQSYNDLEIILIHNEKYRENFDWLRWYPHFKISAINVRGLIDTDRVRDQVLGNISKILKDREIKNQENKDKIRFIPYYLFVIDEPSLILNHSIMEYLQKYDSKLGFSIIYTSQLKANLPENIKTIFKIDNYEYGTLVINEGILVNKKVKLNHVDIKLSNLSRRLSCLKHIKGMMNQIPDSITFFEMYNVNSPKELGIENLWMKNQAYKTLAVPLGVRGKNDYVYLNLHEKAHGPHGLIAGTTGSGKSEIVQSYILSLAVNFHPYEVGFLLIDYKGGGMASLFKNLPHLLGTITNLDGSESMRAMASIRSELARRQQIFNEYEVNHINQYNKLFKNGEAKEPMPHLFLISDEFAELKKEQPDFMRELVSAARIGRSLGIHLILATQKPSGVVDDQIWSNSKFKLALKVQNESDSNEIIKTPDAARITQPGRAYLQVGNNEIYELFQSAWSGAAYENNEDDDSIDDRVYLINHMGQGQLLNNDLSSGAEDLNLKATELDVTVDYINKLFSNLQLSSVKKPWLPPLETKISSPHIDEENIVDAAEFKELDTNISIGIVDIPEAQSQNEYKLNFVKDGNFVIFSSAGFGKTTTLTTIMLSLAVKNSPENLQFFVLDFGNSGLVPMKELPHTRDYIKFDDVVKFQKMCKIIDDESKKRKRILGEASVANFNMYNEVSDEKLPALFIIIDNYDVIKEFGIEAEDFIMKITRDGAGIGIFTIATASRQNAIKFAVLNNFKNKMAHYLFDETETRAIIGKGDYTLPDIPGRAMVKLQNVNIMQVYSAVEFQDELEYANKILTMIGKIKDLYTGDRVESIRMLPEILTISKLKEFADEKKYKNKIPVGLDAENVRTQFIELDGGTKLVVGGMQTGKTNVLKIMLSLRENIETYVFDSKSGELYPYRNQVNQYIVSQDEQRDFLGKMQEIIDERKAEFEKHRAEEPGLMPKIYYASLSPIMVLIDDCDNFVVEINLITDLPVKEIIEEAISVGVTFIASAQANGLKGYDLVTKIFKNSINAIILGNPNDQTVITNYTRNPQAAVDLGYMYNKGKMQLIKMPKVK
ncbi:type VII secretion protein EssC [Clostridium kluyveri]|uniref:Type VII secretion protein EssC n=1 Tax=Clostridium kluyveri TaxID=1534 RepID=A0A1L5F3V3_CLOKL|nr:type VII secretion protein EssC [Clostridium kluyveri]APM37689.1 type VII secretion protein EssC [Clostridium kluyveri]UZQ52286.1 type VII secretion protein EssC [Clostridium kluyveri]